MTWDTSRWDMGYWDTETAVLPVQSMIISQEIYDLLAGNDPGTVEYFADVTYADTDIPMPYVDTISIERSMEQIAGTVHIGFMDSSFPLAGLSQGSKLSVSAGIRYAGKTASMQIFLGRAEKITYPSAGESQRAYLDGYDAGKSMMDETPGTGYTTDTTLPPAISGNIFDWFTTRLGSLGTSGVTLYLRTSAITVPSGTLINYRTLSEAMLALSNAYHYRYLYITGDNRLAVLDPNTLGTVSPLFTLAAGGIQRLQQVDSLIDRINKVPYQKSAVSEGSSVFWYDETGTQQEAAATPVAGLIGTYNDTADQADYPICEGATLANSIVNTAAEMETYAAEWCDETQRERLDLSVRFNPFVDLGDVLQYGTDTYFVYRIRHEIAAGSAWETKLEVRKL